MAEDRYRYANGVMKNRRGYTDQGELDRFENGAFWVRMTELLGGFRSVEGDFDRDHLRAIHKHLLGDVYDWAGEPRDDGQTLRKFGPSPDSILGGHYDRYEDMYEYTYMPAGPLVEATTDTALASLPDPAGLKGLSPVGFADVVAKPWGEVNRAHLFREGNTRSQSVFFWLYARAAGMPFDVNRFNRDPDFRRKFNAGRFLYQATLIPRVLASSIADMVAASPAPPLTATATPPLVSLSAHQSGSLVGGAPVSGLCGSRQTRSGDPCRNRVGDSAYCWRHR